jgi:hypothetical protein
VADLVALAPSLIRVTARFLAQALDLDPSGLRGLVGRPVHLDHGPAEHKRGRREDYKHRIDQSRLPALTKASYGGNVPADHQGFPGGPRGETGRSDRAELVAALQDPRALDKLRALINHRGRALAGSGRRLGGYRV